MNRRYSRRFLRRRGYALMIVIIFSVIFLAMLGMVWNQIGSAMRAFTVRSQQIQRDQGAVQALAHAMRGARNRPAAV